MASETSYTITVSNNLTEKAAIDYLLSADRRFWVPNLASRRHILSQLGMRPSLSRAFDLVYVDEDVNEDGGLLVAEIDRVTLVELKTTRKGLPELPRGFFFGATKNEFDLAEALGERFRFCFVCLHPETPGHVLLSLSELESCIQTKRTQYQINLKSGPDKTRDNVGGEPMERNHLLGMVCGYYLSRFDEDAYDALGFGNRTATHRALGAALGVPARSIQNWRDEFDPMHDNSRAGWRNRPMAPTRLRMAAALGGWGQDEVLRLVRDAIKSPLGPTAIEYLATAADVD